MSRRLENSIHTIQRLCETNNHYNGINAVRNICNNFNLNVETDTSPTTIDAIREVCNDFFIHSETRDSASTIDTIKEICQNSNKNQPIDDYNDRPPIESNQSYRADPGNTFFQSIIVPVTKLIPNHTGAKDITQFKMRRKNKTVTLQWEPFDGLIAANGIAFLTVMQSIWNTPPYIMSWPILIKYKDVIRMTNITIDPNTNNGNIRFYLNTDNSANNIQMGDAFHIYSSSVTWIID